MSVINIFHYFPSNGRLIADRNHPSAPVHCPGRGPYCRAGRSMRPDASQGQRGPSNRLTSPLFMVLLVVIFVSKNEKSKHNLQQYVVALTLILTVSLKLMLNELRLISRRYYKRNRKHATILNKCYRCYICSLKNEQLPRM